jgi:predicted HicB family RNase H-like nuclease
MKITLSVDAALIERAREIAARQGTSLNDLVRAYV